MPQPYAARRPSLHLPKALDVLVGEEPVGLRVNWEHRASPFDVKYLQIELLKGSSEDS
jgi:hypothetical protein